MGEKYSHLSLSAREEISRGLASGSSLLAIASRLGRNRGTISREVARNGPDKERYRLAEAVRLADQRSRKPRRKRKLSSEGLWGKVVKLLMKSWSPEEIAGRFKREHAQEKP